MKSKACFILGSYLFLQPANPMLQNRQEGFSVERMDQAREVLGETAEPFVQSTEDRQDIRRFIANEVRESLPEQFKEQWPLITRAVFDESRNQRLDPLFLVALIKHESKFNPTAVGTHGEIGLIQIKPDTAQWIAERSGMKWRTPESLFNPAYNLKVGAAYISYLRARYKNQGMLYLPAYNLGPQMLSYRLRLNIIPHKYSEEVLKHYVALYRSWSKSLSEGRVLASR